MRIYLAAQFERKDELRQYRSDIEALGYQCTSSWLSGKHDNPNFLQHYAIQDLRDIDAAWLFIVFTAEPETPIMRGGHVFETGYAYAKGMPVYIVGPRQNIFHHLEHIVQWDKWEHCLKGLARG